LKERNETKEKQRLIPKCERFLAQNHGWLRKQFSQNVTTYKHDKQANNCKRRKTKINSKTMKDRKATKEGK
jgi:hypothetical protein